MVPEKVEWESFENYHKPDTIRWQMCLPTLVFPQKWKRH